MKTLPSLKKFEVEPLYQEKLNALKPQFQNLSLVKLAKEYMAAKNHKDEIEDVLSVINQNLEAINQILVDKMEDENMHSFKAEDGTTIFQKTAVYPKVVDKEVAFAWIKKNKQEHLLSIQHMSLKSFCTELLEQGNDLPEGVECYLKTAVGYRRAAK